jgi:hypothetical protein
MSSTRIDKFWQVLVAVLAIYVVALSLDIFVVSWRLDVPLEEVWDNNQVRTMMGWEMISDEDPYVIRSTSGWYVRTNDGQVYSANMTLEADVREELNKLRLAQKK